MPSGYVAAALTWSSTTATRCWPNDSGRQCPTATLPTRELYQKDASVLGFVISNASIADLADAAGAINALLAERRLRGRIGTRLRLPDAARAHRMLEDPPPSVPPGRIIVTP